MEQEKTTESQRLQPLEINEQRPFPSGAAFTLGTSLQKLFLFHLPLFLKLSRHISCKNREKDHT